MESLKNFRWRREVNEPRLAYLAQRGKNAFWVKDAGLQWDRGHTLDKATKLIIATSQYYGEKRIPKSGLYISGSRQTFHRNRADEMSPSEIIRPFVSNELISKNALQMSGSPQGWLEFTKKYGLIGHTSSH